MKMKLIVITLGMMLLVGSAAADAIITVGSGTAVQNSSVNLDVNISGVTNLYGFGFDVFFNSSVLSITGDTAGSLFTGSGITYTPIGGATADNVAGTYTSAGYLLIGSGFPGLAVSDSASGVLITLNFNTNDTLGFGLISIDNVNLVDGNNDPITSFTTKSGGITVPEPSSLFLLGTGIAGAALRNWRRFRKIGFRL